MDIVAVVESLDLLIPIIFGQCPADEAGFNDCQSFTASTMHVLLGLAHDSLMTGDSFTYCNSEAAKDGRLGGTPGI